MTLDDKRKVIEVLLCASGSQVVATVTVAQAAGVNLGLVLEATTPTYRDAPSRTRGYYYAHRQIEAAYRLIESSAVLRREWFGAA